MTRVATLADKVGTELGLSEWVLVDQERVNQFADATGDHQWIHVDQQRAADGPFGATIAHGYLTLSMMPIFLGPFLAFEDAAMSLNYGVDTVRFPHHVPVGSKVRGRVTLESFDATARGVRLGLRCEVEIDGADKPACVAHPIALVIPA